MLPDKTLRDATQVVVSSRDAGWYRVVRGRRPPLEVWPKQQWSSWWQRSQWPNVAAVRHQTTSQRFRHRSSPRHISGSRCTREIESDGEHDCKGRQFGTEFEQVQPIAVRPVLRVDFFYGLRGIRVGEATNPGPSDVAPTQWDSGAEFSSERFDLTQREVVVEEASHPNPSQVAPTQWDLTARDAETEDEQSDTASCISTPAEGRVGANLEQLPTHVIDALQEDLPVSRRHRRLVLVFAQEFVSSHDQVEPTAVDSPADSPSDSGHSARVMEVVPEVFEAAGRFELSGRFLHTGLEFLDCGSSCCVPHASSGDKKCSCFVEGSIPKLH